MSEPVESEVQVRPSKLPADVAALFGVSIEAEPELGELRVAAVVDATVRSVGDEAIEVDLPGGVVGKGSRVEGLLEGEAPPEIGATIPVLLEAFDGGVWQVALGKGRRLALAERIERLSRERAQVEAELVLVARGGFWADFEGIRCFVPGRDSGIPFARSMESLGAKLTFEVMGWDEKRGQLLLGRARLAAGDRDAERRRRLEAVTEGAIVRGRVMSVKPFGAFVEIAPGVEGLLHVSEMSLEHVDSAASLVAVGDEVDVRVVSVDGARGRIALSRRDALEADRRARMEAIEAGSDHDGVVTRLTEFGAFIRLADGVEGLCHVSELTWFGRPARPSDLLSVGDAVRVRVLEVRAENGRIALSIRATQANPWATFVESVRSGDTVRGTITRIEDYGLFLRVAEGVEGLCHVSDLTWEGRPERPSDAGSFSLGDALEVRVLEIDAERQRLKLGLKHMSGDPWDAASDRLVVGAVYVARVTGFSENAAYVEVAPHVQGRLHISEISEERVESVRSALRIDQEVEVMTTEVDRGRRRLAVSMKAVHAQREADTPRQHDDSPGALGAMADVLAKSGLVGRREE